MNLNDYEKNSRSNDDNMPKFKSRLNVGLSNIIQSKITTIDMK